MAPCTSLLPLLAAAVLPAFAAAQTLKTAIIPSDNATSEGATYNTNAHVTFGIGRAQFLYESHDLKIPNGSAIHEIGFRQNKDHALTGIKLQLEVLMSPSKLEARHMSSTFANNPLGTQVTKIAKRIVDLPSFTKPIGSPSKNHVLFKLDSPWTHDSSKNLLVEYRIHLNSNSNKAYTYPLDKARFRSKTTTTGTGCKTGSTIPTASFSQARIGQRIYFYLSRGTASSGAVGLFNVQKLATPVAIPNAPGCTLYVSPILTWGMATNTSGSATLWLTLPYQRALKDVTFWGQWAMVDIFANKLGLAFSNAASVQVGADPLVSRNYYINLTSKTGWRTLHDGTIGVFRYK